MKFNTQAFKAALDASVRATGRDLKVSTLEAATYTAQRADHLATIAATGEPGLDEAVEAARDSVLTFLGIEAVAAADAADARIVGLVHGALAAVLGLVA